MADYLETPGRTTLKAYVDANQISVNAYIRQFDKATDDAKKNLQKNLKQHSDLNIPIEREAQASN